MKMVKTMILDELVAVNSMWMGSLSIELRQAIVKRCVKKQSFGCDFNYKQDIGIERRLNILLLSTLSWILIGVGVVILVVFIGTKIKDRYY